MRTGLHLPNYGPSAKHVGAMASVAEAVGFSSVWLSDHVVLVEGAVSKYPFSQSGRFFLPPSADWYDWVATAGSLAATTTHVQIGVGVAVLPLRHPLLLAKQVATLDQLSGGRILLGVGAGWLTEEMEALGVDPSGRGAAMDGGLALLRAAWTGAPPGQNYGAFEIPGGVRCMPVPVQDPLPLFIGGVSRVSARRVAKWAQGWYGTGMEGAPSAPDVVAMTELIKEECSRLNRDAAEVEIALRVAIRTGDIGSGGAVERIAEYAEAGVTRISFDVEWDPDLREMERRLSRLLAAIEGV